MSFLVYERQTAGHRENYATTVAQILGADLAIGTALRDLWRALTSRHLVVTTLESAPRLYTLLMLLRGTVARRSTVIATRSHVVSRGRWPWPLLRSLTYRVLRHFPPVQLLTITPPEGADDPRMQFIEDIEFWDLPPAVFAQPPHSVLADRVRHSKQGRRVLLVSGTLETSKGLGFLDAVLDHAPDLLKRFALVCAGEVMAPSRAALQPLKAKAMIWEDRFLTRDEMLSLYAEADVVWCCYHPDYDVSSGIFGRSIQFGLPAIVRAGSLIDRLQRRLGHGVALDYDDAAAAAIALARTDFMPSGAASRYEQGSMRLREIILGHRDGAAARPTEV